MTQKEDSQRIEQFLLDIKRTNGHERVRVMNHMEHYFSQNTHLLTHFYEKILDLIHINDIDIHVFLAKFIDRICRINPNRKKNFFLTPSSP
jgi:hypothetical protein